MSRPSLRTIEIDQLTVGMFVTKLDISWLDSPFMSHTKMIKKQADVTALIDAGVKTLVIDTAKGAEPDFNPLKGEQPTLNGEQSDLLDSALKAPRKTAHLSLQQEMNAALAIRTKVKKAVEQLQSAFETEEKIIVEELTPLIDHTIDSLERNDQALMNLVHLSRKSQKLSDHSFGTFCLVLNLAMAADIPESDREQIGLAALMHEAGWSQLPLHLMGKRTRYTPQEQKLVHRHTDLAEKILSQSELPALTMRMIREHHELLDGSGYPKGLSGNQIHPLTSYLSVVDAYEERVHQLADTPGMAPHKALRSLYHDAEKGLYCAEVVASLISMLGIFPVGSAVVLNTGEKAVVVEFHRDSPLNPEVKIVYDAQGNGLNPAFNVDLSQQQGVSEPRQIEAALDLRSKSADPLRRMLLDEDDFL